MPNQTPAAAPARGTQTQVLLRAGAQEAWRLIRHPLHIAGWLYTPSISGWLVRHLPLRATVLLLGGRTVHRDPPLHRLAHRVPTFAASVPPRHTTTTRGHHRMALQHAVRTRDTMGHLPHGGPGALRRVSPSQRLAWCYVWAHDPGIDPAYRPSPSTPSRLSPSSEARCLRFSSPAGSPGHWCPPWSSSGSFRPSTRRSTSKRPNTSGPPGSPRTPTPCSTEVNPDRAASACFSDSCRAPCPGT